MSVRPFLRGATLVATTVLVTSCGSGDAGSSGGTAASSSPSGSGGAFPVTVETAFGDVEIPEEPQRVVALGWSDAETALALGVQPVGASDWLAFGGEGVGPWAEGLYDEAPEIIETLEPSLEAIAALDPDLILDTRSPATQDRYDARSEEHTSELQSRQYLVCRLLLETKTCPACSTPRSRTLPTSRRTRPYRESTRLHSSHANRSYPVFCCERQSRTCEQPRSSTHAQV